MNILKWAALGVGVYFGLAWLKGKQTSACVMTDQACLDAVAKKWAWFRDPSNLI
jgi:hypothetical protein